MRKPGSRRLVGLFFAAYLLVSAALAAPVYSTLETWAGRNAFAEPMLRGFDHLWAADFLFWRAGFVAAFGRAVVWTAALFAVFQAVLMGGALEVLHREPEPGEWLSVFGSGCARHFGAFLRLLVLGPVLYGLAVLALLLVLFAVLVVLGLVALAVGGAPPDLLEEWPLLLITGVGVALVLVALFAVNLLLDYARVRIVAEDRASALRALRAALSFLRKNFRSAAGAYALWGTAGLALTLLYLLLASLIPQSNIPGMVVWFAVGQLFLFLRLWLRLGFYSSATALLTREAAEPAAALAPASAGVSPSASDSSSL